jgi:hypothetical protein
MTIPSDDQTLQDSISNEIVAGPLAIDEKLRAAVCKSIKGSSLSRTEIAEQVSKQSGVYITKHSLDAFTSLTKPGHRFPAAIIPAFCEITNDLSTLKLLAQSLGCMVLTAKEKAYIELIKLEREREKLEARCSELKKTLEQP